MPVDARRLIRKMRGGAQAHLLEAADGCYYVVKFSNNPQHRRVLINEWISYEFLRYLGLAAPTSALVQITPDFLRDNPNTAMQLGNRIIPAAAGWHFGSRFPGDPARTVVYDFLPDALLNKVENLPDFLGTLVFDQWIGNADSRQAIFFRARLKEWLSPNEAHAERLGFVAQMVDHGYAFEGPHWKLHDAPLHGLYHRPSVYEKVRGLDDFQPWLDRIVHFPEEIVDRAIRQIPAAWFEGDEDELNALLERLLRRRRRVPDLLEACRNARSGLFPNWK
ncbi:MAG: HipA family kinase [Bryobacteraceae bacterium]